MLVLDGSSGEGGGQILRSSLALSMVTGTAFRIENVRAKRPKPGLMRQHLAAVRAAAEISSARVEGDEIGSRALTFRPGRVRPGDYAFAVGTAGSTTLIFQTVLPALIFASGSSHVTLEGGTHNPLAPPFDFLRAAYLPLLARMGPRVDVALERPGFYPAGGGRFTATIDPVETLDALVLLERGEILDRRATAVVSKIPESVAERELRVIRDHFAWPEESFRSEVVTSSPGPGNIVTIEIEAEHVTEVFCGFGEIRRPAEKVAMDAVAECRRYLASDAPVGEHLADQIILPLALAGSGAFRATAVTRHTTTHIELLKRFLDREIAVERIAPTTFEIRVGG